MRKQSRQRLLFAFVFASLLFLVIPGVYNAATLRVHAASGISDEWPMFRHDSQRTGYSSNTAPNTNEIRWVYNTTSAVSSSPAVANGRVIVGVSNGDILALNSTTGEKIWTHETGAGQNSIWSSPAVDSGRVFIGTRDRNLYCLNESTGVVLWTYLTGNEIDSSPLVKDGKVFFGSNDDIFYCLNVADGSLVWSYATGADIYSSPAIMDDIVYVGSYDSKMYAINASTGLKVWNFSANSAIASSPALSNGKVFFSTLGNKVYSLNANTGALIWNATTGGSIFARSSPAVADGRVFIGADDGKFYCFSDSTGMTLWVRTADAGIWSSPAVADGKVFFGSENGKFYSWNENSGDTVWSSPTLDRAAPGPAISNGTVFVCCGGTFSGGRVYAYGAKYVLPTKLELFLNSQTSLLGFKVNLNGTLKSNGAGIGGVSIVLSYSVTGGQTWNDITAVPTSADGSYSAVWQPSATGTYLVRASWASNYPYQAAESLRTLSVTTLNDTYVFSVTSNSTVSALAFNSTSRQLSFTVTGETGTTGFVDMAIAKSLVGNITDLKIYLDGVNLNYAAASSTDSWFLHFTYAHSTHSVTVNLGAEQVPEFPAWTIIPIIAIIQLFAIALLKKKATTSRIGNRLRPAKD